MFSQSVAARGAGKNARGYVTAFQGTADYPIVDADGDGFTDDEEADCGSDPNHPDSTCDNVGGGGETGSLSFRISIDITINLPNGAPSSSTQVRPFPSRTVCCPSTAQ
jgi:hypothetical protein